jgi:hypothetical protein
MTGRARSKVRRGKKGKEERKGSKEKRETNRKCESAGQWSSRYRAHRSRRRCYEWWRRRVRTGEERDEEKKRGKTREKRRGRKGRREETYSCPLLPAEQREGQRYVAREERF